MDFTDMLSPEEQVILAREGDDMAAAQAQDLEARRARCEEILAKLEGYLWKDEIDILRYECGLDD